MFEVLFLFPYAIPVLLVNYLVAVVLVFLFLFFYGVILVLDGFSLFELGVVVVSVIFSVDF